MIENRRFSMDKKYSCYISTTLVLIFLLAACAPAIQPTHQPAAPTPVPPTPTPPTAAPTVVAPLPTPDIPADAAGQYSTVEIPAPSLSNNLIGEPDVRTLYIYLPPSYDISERRYPVVYFLPGHNSTEVPQFGFPKGVDQLVRNGAIREMIIVVANGRNELDGSFYVNSPVTGNWEDFIVVDVVNYVDATYRTIPEASARGLSGHSMGGFGALNIAMHHPDVFSAVYSLSPGLFDENGLVDSQIFFSEYINKRFVTYQAKIMAMPAEEANNSMVVLAPDKFILGYGLAFAPNPEQPPYFDYPYSEVNGQLVRDEAIWKKWESGFGSIAKEIQQYKSNFASLKGLVLDVGSADEYQWIPKGCDYLDEQLTAAGISHLYYKHDGDHLNRLAERLRDYMLPFFSNTLDFGS
jgi:enterochelin esterase-like enzyme